jgi:hypothetical protein
MLWNIFGAVDILTKWFTNVNRNLEIQVGIIIPNVPYECERLTKIKIAWFNSVSDETKSGGLI